MKRQIKRTKWWQFLRPRKRFTTAIVNELDALKLSLLVEATGSGVWTWDFKKKHLDFSENCLSIMSASLNATTPALEQLKALLNTEQLTLTTIFFDSLQQDAAPKSYELKISLQHGDIKHIKINACGYRNAKGEITFLVGTLQDLTSTEQLRKLSHDLRTPLNVILGWATMLRRPAVTPEHISEGLTVIERNVRVQVQLLDNALTTPPVAPAQLDHHSK